MAFQRWRVWQWVLVSLVVGAALGLVALQGPSEEPASQSMSVAEFVRGINRRTESGGSVFTDIVIQPARLDPTGRPVQMVTFHELRRHIKTGKWDPVVDYWMAAPIPFFARPPTPEFRVADFLKGKQKEMPSLKYTYAWWAPAALPGDIEAHPWQKPATMFAVVLGLSVLLIGIAWPLVIRLLVKLGLGNPEEEAGIDLSKVSSRGAAPAIAATSPTSDEQARLDALNAELEAKVSGMLINQDAEDEAAEIRAEEAAVRQLSNTSGVDETPTAQPKEDRDFTGGVFYPVARPGGKKD